MRGSIVALLVGGLGVGFFLLISYLRPLGFGFYDGIPTGDMAQSLNGIALFRDLKSLGFPLFNIYQETLSVNYNIAFSDSIPGYALFVRLVHQVGWDFNYLMGWYLLVFFLQSFSFYLLLTVMGVEHKIFRVFGALLSLLMPSFLLKVYSDHLALSSQFITILPIALFFASRNWGLAGSAVGWSITLCVAILIHPYFAAMNATIFLGHLVDRVYSVGGKIQLKQAWILVSFLPIGVVLGVGGYIEYAGFGGLTDGFGIYSANALAQIWPQHSGVFGETFSKPVSQVNDEAVNYLGFGTLLLLGAAALLALKQRLQPSGTGWSMGTPGLWLWVLALFIYSLATPIRVGNVVSLDVGSLYAPFTFLTEWFRTSGRFMWSVSYMLLAAGVFQVARATTAAGKLRVIIPCLLTVIVAIQVIDVRPIVLQIINKPLAGLNGASWSRLFQLHDNMVLIPRSGCGETAGAHDGASSMSYAAKYFGLSVNSFPAARHQKPCEPPGIFLPEKNTLYAIFSDEYHLLDLYKMVDVEYCRSTPSMYVCSRHWGDMPDATIFSDADDEPLYQSSTRGKVWSGIQY